MKRVDLKITFYSHVHVLFTFPTITKSFVESYLKLSQWVCKFIQHNVKTDPINTIAQKKWEDRDLSIHVRIMLPNLILFRILNVRVSLLCDPQMSTELVFTLLWLFKASV